MSDVLNTIGRVIFRLGFEISPIVLQGGIASNIPGGMLPIVAITEAANFVATLLNGTIDVNLDNFFAHFRPLPGSTLVDNTIGSYPFANQAVAANAVITQPLKLSMQMICPVRQAGGYTAKLITFMALKQILDNHINLGGLFVVATPAYIYQNLILLTLTDTSNGESAQVQNTWQFDFIKPLVTQAQAAQSLNTLMSKLNNGQPTAGATSGPDAVTGTPVGGSAGQVTGGSNLAGTAAPGYVDVTAGYTPGTVTTTDLP